MKNRIVLVIVTEVHGFSSGTRDMTTLWSNEDWDAGRRCNKYTQAS